MRDHSMVMEAQMEETYTLDGFEKISLAHIADDHLMQRIDVKFIFNIQKLNVLLTKMQPYYNALEIDHSSTFNYETIYFDTANLNCFKDAKIKKPNRFKIRKRTYKDSNLAFLELKKKIKGLRTIKTRIVSSPTEHSQANPIFNSKEIAFLKNEGTNGLDAFVPQLKINYKRISLISKNLKERVTLDYDMFISKGDKTVFFDGLVIAELKKNKFSAGSNFLSAVKALGIEKRRISKYAIGMVLLTDGLGSTRYKTKISKIKSISKIRYGSGNNK